MEQQEYAINHTESASSDITSLDMKRATEYLMRQIICMDVEATCRMRSGCEGCPFAQFRQTVLSAFEKLSQDCVHGNQKLL